MTMVDEVDDGFGDGDKGHGTDDTDDTEILIIQK
jgi:hypothetical protein